MLYLLGIELELVSSRGKWRLEWSAEGIEHDPLAAALLHII
jgi:hypothetical protein